MCTVIVAYKYFTNIPLLIAANRDEFSNRKTDPPSIINYHPKILAPRDKLRQGTFTGINEWGLSVAITNLSGIVDKDINKKSRGLLVLRALGSPDIDRMLTDFKHIDFSLYNFFQLIAADRNKIAILRYDQEVKIETYDKGLFILSNWDAIKDVRDYKQSIILSTIDRIPADADFGTILEYMKNILSNHNGKDMRFQICVHTENYGTLSSIIIAPYQDNPVFYYSIGPVCKNKFRSYNEDLRNLLNIPV